MSEAAEVAAGVLSVRTALRVLREALDTLDAHYARPLESDDEVRLWRMFIDAFIGVMQARR